MSSLNTTRRASIAAALDVAIVVAFVAIGRRSHDEGEAVAGIARVAAPFLIGLGAAWLAAHAWKAPTSFRTGLIVWPVTVAVGMLLRRFVFDDSTALSFIIVATIFNGLLLVGWRALYRLRR